LFLVVSKVKFVIRVVHKLRGKVFGFLRPPTPLRWHFVWYERWQKVSAYPPPLVNVVCERLSLMNKCTKHKSFLSHKRSYLVIKSRVFSSVRPLCFTSTICVINLFLPKNGNFGALETPGPLITVIWNWKFHSEVVCNIQLPSYFVLRKIHFKRWEITYRYLNGQNNHQKRLRIIKVTKMLKNSWNKLTHWINNSLIFI
jgi:hypothetical protein